MPGSRCRAAPASCSAASVLSAVADIHRQRQASLQLLEKERAPRFQILAALIESHKREILEQRWLKQQHSSSCCDDDEHKPPAAKKKKIVESSYALPDDIVEWVQSLKVKELQEDLHSRNIETNGLKLKKDLRKRLLQALESERMQPPRQQHNQQQQQQQPLEEDESSVPMEVEVVTAGTTCDQSSVGQATDYSESGMESNMAVAPPPTPPLETTIPPPRPETEQPARMSVEYADDEKGMTDDSIMESKQPPVVIGRVSATGNHKEYSDETMVDVAEPEKVVAAPVPEPPPAKENTTSSAQKQSSPKSRSRSPLKKVGSKVQSCIKALRAHRGGGVDNSNKKQQHTGDQHDKVPLLAAPLDNYIIESSSAVATSSSHQQPPSSSNNSTASAVDKLQSEFRRAPSSKLSKGSSASKVAHLKAQQEARRAKMEEIRSKSKPIANSTTTPSLPTTLKVGNGTGSGTQTQGEDGKRKLLTAKMREKALRQMTGSKPLEPLVPAKAELTPPPPVAAAVPVFIREEEKDTLPAPPTFIPVPKVVAAPASSSIKKSPIVPRSPMETYELSDADGDSESDSDSESFSKPKKAVPTWAMKANLLPALERQYIGEVKIDPDEIFGEVQSCDLEAIFDNKKSRYQRRTSSGNWTQDRATAVEKLTYKRVMGYEGYASEA